MRFHENSACIYVTHLMNIALGFLTRYIKNDICYELRSIDSFILLANIHNHLNMID